MFVYKGLFRSFCCSAKYGLHGNFRPDLPCAVLLKLLVCKYSKAPTLPNANAGSGVFAVPMATPFGSMALLMAKVVGFFSGHGTKSTPSAARKLSLKPNAEAKRNPLNLPQTALALNRRRRMVVIPMLIA